MLTDIGQKDIYSALYAKYQISNKARKKIKETSLSKSNEKK